MGIEILFFLINWFLFLYCSSNFKLSNTILVNGKHPAPIVGAWVVTGQNNNFAKCWVNVLNTSLWFKYANLGLPPATSGLGNGPCMEIQDCYMYMYIYGQRQSSALAQCQGSILVKQIAVQWDNILAQHTIIESPSLSLPSANTLGWTRTTEQNYVKPTTKFQVYIGPTNMDYIGPTMAQLSYDVWCIWAETDYGIFIFSGGLHWHVRKSIPVGWGSLYNI